jgi:hypothetical protein
MKGLLGQLFCSADHFVIGRSATTEEILGSAGIDVENMSGQDRTRSPEVFRSLRSPS